MKSLPPNVIVGEEVTLKTKADADAFVRKLQSHFPTRKGEPMAAAPEIVVGKMIETHEDAEQMGRELKDILSKPVTTATESQGVLWHDDVRAKLDKFQDLKDERKTLGDKIQAVKDEIHAMMSEHKRDHMLVDTADGKRELAILPELKIKKLKKGKSK